LNAIRTLVMAVEVFSAWRDDADVCELTPARLQKAAQAVAATTRALAHGTLFADDALMAGLLHNIGHWVLLKECPQQLQRAIDLARTHSIPLHVAEQDVIGASAAAVGAYLLGIWGLPYPVIEAVAFQHSPQRVAQTRFDVLATLVTARSLQAANEPLLNGVAESSEIVVDARYLQALQAPFDWPEAQARVCATNGELH
jgi:HD-like signal output (HDOD) protein